MAKRALCLLLALVTLFSLSVPALAEEEPVAAEEEVVTEEVVEEVEVTEETVEAAEVVETEELVEEPEATEVPEETAEPMPAAESGECGEGVTYTLTDDGLLTISGNGEIREAAFIWRNDIKTVVIENGVTSIGRMAFEQSTALTSVTVPGSVTTIKEWAFGRCTSLTSITIPSGVTTIEESAFNLCESLTSATIPDGVTSIADSTFANCPSLISVTIPNSVTSIGLEAFANCKSLADMTLPDSVTSTGKSSIFSGLVFCADCGAKMYYCTSVKFDKRRDFFVCSTHRHRKDQCSAHYIRAVVLEDIVLRHMRMVISYVANHEAHFRAVMGERLKLASDEAIRVNKKKLAKAEKRLDELDRIFMRLYEDRVNGMISDERFASMSKSYEAEQTQLKKEVETLTKEVAQQAQKANDVERFIAQAHKYVGLEELTPYALHELVKAIYIEAPDESSGKRRQNIHISYDFVGFIPIQELMQEEMA